MLSSLLFILKIIGIILASLLGIVLFLLLLVLFIPLRYKVSATKKEEVVANARVSWLFRILSIKVAYQDEVLTYSVRIFGYLLLSDKPKKKKHRRKKSKVSSDKDNVQARNREETKPVISKKKVEEKVPTALIEKKQVKKTNKSSIFDKLKNIPNRIRLKIKSIKEKIRDILRTMKDIFRKIRLIKTFLLHPLNRPGFILIFRTIRKILKHISPQKLIIHLHFGTGDPCSTGQALGVLCALRPQVLNTVTIIPDFDEKVLEGDLYASGRIRAFTLLIIAIKLIIDKEFKHLISEFNNLKEEL